MYDSRLINESISFPTRIHNPKYFPVVPSKCVKKRGTYIIISMQPYIYEILQKGIRIPLEDGVKFII